jgi:hypothetical protein
MKNHLRRLKIILKIFNENDFYAITLNEGLMHLQGHFDGKLVEKAFKYKFKNTEEYPNGYFELKRGVYEITLT